MSKTQIAIVAVLATLVVVMFSVLGFAIFMATKNGDLSTVSVGSPHESPEVVARAWLEAVVAGNCDEAATYIPPDQSGFLCGGEDVERIALAEINLADVDEGNAVAEYTVTFYGRFVLYLYPASGPREEMDRLHPVEKESIWVAVEEINGEYYVSSLSGIYLMLLKPHVSP